MEKQKRMCGFHWTTDDERLGSNHGCTNDHGHAGPHVCACTALLTGLPVSQAILRVERNGIG